MATTCRKGNMFVSLLLLLTDTFSLFKNIEVYLGIIAGMLTAGATIWKFVVIPARKILKKISDAISSIGEISSSIKPNGGSSIMDRLSRIEKTILYSESRHKLLTSAVNVAMFETDSQGTCLWVAPSWTEITGIDNEDAHENGWLNSIHPDEREEVYKQWHSAVEQKREFRMSYNIVNIKTNDIIHVRGLARALRDHKGNVIGFVGLIKRI